MSSKRPICRTCDDLADVLVISSGNVASASAFAYCDQHDPDPEEYGNRTKWEGKLTLRRYDREPRDYTVYGRPGGDNYHGLVMHIELPDSTGVLCEHEISSRKRFDLTRAIPDGASLCGKCLSSTKRWREHYSDEVVRNYVYKIREIAERTGDLSDYANRWLEYPEVSPKEGHKMAEGIQET